MPQARLRRARIAGDDPARQADRGVTRYLPAAGWPALLQRSTRYRIDW